MKVFPLIPNLLMKPSAINIISWNANGLGAHLDELLYFLDTNTICPDFICIQETWLYSDLLPNIPGFNFIHTYRNKKKGGGSAIYVRNYIEFSKIDKVTFESIDIEVAGVSFKNKNHE